MGLITALDMQARKAPVPVEVVVDAGPIGDIRFSVSDDGTGYDTTRTPMGSGIRNMADRLAALGGRLEVWSAPGQGTTITGHLPVPVIASDPVRLTIEQHQSSPAGEAVRSL